MAHPLDLEHMSGGWFIEPKAFEKSVVLGGDLRLFPVKDPEEVATTLTTYAERLVRRSFQAGRRHAQANMRKALFE